MKKKDITIKGSGTYVQCFQRIGDRPLADLNFFDGEHDLEEVKKRRDALNEAIACMEGWEYLPDSSSKSA